MKEYRSAIRSRNLIKKAFIELLNEKDLQDLTVVDVVNRADISRNTFYAHYTDIYDVLNDLENEFVDKLRIYLGDDTGEELSPAHIIQKIIRFVETDPDTNKIFITAPTAAGFYDKIKNLFKEKLETRLNTEEIKDVDGLSVFLECISSGFINLYGDYLSGKSKKNAEELTKNISDLFIFGVELYK